MVSLSPLEIEQFARNGFLGPYRVLESGAAEQVRDRIIREVLTRRSEVYAHTSGDIEKLDYTRDRHLDSPLLYRVASAPPILSRVSSLLGADVLLWRSDVFWQRPDDPATHPHQDIDLSGTRVVPCIEAPEPAKSIATIRHPNAAVMLPLCISAWIAFDHITRDNGALYFVPGSHHVVIPEVPGQGFAGRKLVLSRTFESSEHHVIHIEPGQFVLFHNLLVHGSYDSTTGSRLAWTTRYVTPETRVYPNGPLNAQGQDLSRFGSLLVTGRARTENVLRSPPPLHDGTILDEPSTI